MDIKTTRRRNQSRLAQWTFAWTATTALAAFGPQFLWDDAAGLTALAILLNVGIGIGMVLANRRLLEGLDELERKIHLESLALTLGLTLIVGIGYSLLDSTDIIPWDAEISFLVIFMGLCYLLAVVINQKRYS
ncbi:MAG: hypothetical protein R3252_07985 [Robiginitalea sp.]|nr:hypothetical protein [Robiginitalea sp.]